MPIYETGDKIRSSRLRQGITQEELASGICSIGTISKIEHGNQIPSVPLFEAIMQRLGEPLHAYTIPVSLKEMQSQKIYREFAHYIIKDDIASASNHLQQYSVILQQNRAMNEQLYSYMLCVWHSKNQKDPYLVIKKLEDALYLSMPDYKGSLPNTKKRLTFHEINIFNILAIQYLKIGNLSEAFFILKCLKEYFETNDIDETEKSRIYPMILCNYADLLSLNGSYKESYEIFESGKEICMTHQNLIMLPFLLSGAGRASSALGEGRKAKERFWHASSLFELLGCKQLLSHMKEANGTERALLAII